MRSASTRFCANDATSTPEPALIELISFCAAARLAAAVVDVVLLALDDVVVVAVLAVFVVELTVVAMIQYFNRRYRHNGSTLEPHHPKYLNKLSCEIFAKLPWAACKASSSRFMRAMASV